MIVETKNAPRDFSVRDLQVIYSSLLGNILATVVLVAVVGQTISMIFMVLTIGCTLLAGYYVVWYLPVRIPVVSVKLSKHFVYSWVWKAPDNSSLFFQPDFLESFVWVSADGSQKAYFFGREHVKVFLDHWTKLLWPGFKIQVEVEE